MREIKFRVWYDGQMRVLDKMMVGVWQIGFSGTHYVDLTEEDKEDAVVMQYTGFKDKNGTDIYEGDILEYFRQKPDNGEFYPDRRKRRKVEFKQHDYWLGYNFRPPTQKEVGYWEVIGNIWANPDLLK